MCEFGAHRTTSTAKKWDSRFRARIHPPIYCGLGLCDVLSCDLYQCATFTNFGDFFGPSFFSSKRDGMQVFREHTERRGSGLRLPSHSQDSSGTQCQTTYRGTGARRKKYEASVILISRTRRLIGGLRPTRHHEQGQHSRRRFPCCEVHGALQYSYDRAVGIAPAFYFSCIRTWIFCSSKQGRTSTKKHARAQTDARYGFRSRESY